jgi:ATP/maltotriose-dependent transcriptional regulator MalT
VAGNAQGSVMTAMTTDAWSGAHETVAPWPRSARDDVMHAGPARRNGIPGQPRHARHAAQWTRRAIELAEPQDRSDEPTVAVACAVLCGAMVAQGRFGEAWHWLGRAERILQLEGEPSTGMLRHNDIGLFSQILGLLAPPGQPAAAPDATPGIRDGVRRPRETLTEGETRVLRYLPTHLHATEIAGELNVSANTVKTHLRHLYQKLGAHSRGEAVEHARAFGLLASSHHQPAGKLSG